MGDLLRDAETWLERKRRNFVTHTVTYSRGEDSVEVLATVGRTEFEQADEYGLVHRLESRDFLITVADLVLSGAAIMPQSGDRILEVQSGAVVTYEVLATGPLPPFSYSDAQRITYRIHTKQVG